MKSKNLTALTLTSPFTTRPTTTCPTRDAFLQSILGNGSNGWLDQQGVNFILFVDLSGNIVAFSGFDSLTQTALELPDDLKAHVRRDDRLLACHAPKD
jgi:sensor domain CHASE-containing protein